MREGSPRTCCASTEETVTVSIDDYSSLSGYGTHDGLLSSHEDGASVLVHGSLRVAHEGNVLDDDAEWEWLRGARNGEISESSPCALLD